MSRVPHPRFTGFLVVLVLTGLAASFVWTPERALIAAFDVAAGGFILSCLPLWLDDTAAAARRRGARDDGGRVLLLLVTLISFCSVMIATGLMVSTQGGSAGANLAICILTLVLAWTFANCVFAFHYSHLYYDHIGDADRRGLDFPGTDEPSFADFCYFSFVIGMTCQVSDVQIRDRMLRQTVTAQGVSAFFFNLGILALAVNVTARVI